MAPCLEPSLVTETSIVEGELVFKPKRSIKNMDSFLLWSMAWRTYEELLVGFDPSLYSGLVAYRIFIQTCAAKHWWPSVYSYDVRNRAKHSMNHSFLFHQLDNDIYVTTMDATTIKPNVKQCNRCKSIWHMGKDCPFSEEGALAPPTRQTQTPSGQQGASSGRQNGNTPMSSQVCFNWNAGRCHDSRCVRRHVCERCGGPQPLPRCANCNYGAPRQSNITQGNQQPYSSPPPSNNTLPAGRVG
jgi:hypothetical protein